MQASVMIDNNEIKKLIEDGFPQFELDLTLCSPSGMRLSKQQYMSIFSKIHEIMPEHARVCAKLRVSFQASSKKRVNDENKCEKIQSIHSLKLYAQYSDPRTPALIEYQITTVGNDFKVSEHSSRELAGIRKQSLHGRDHPIVLIVDDDIVVSMIIERELKKINSNIDVYSATNGEDAVKLYKQYYHCSLVFMDFHMPEKNGLEAIGEIQQFQKEYGIQSIPIVGLSAMTDCHSDFEKAVDYFISKPFEVYQICECVEKLAPKIMIVNDDTTEQDELFQGRFGLASPRLFRFPKESTGLMTRKSVSETSGVGEENSFQNSGYL